MDIVMKTALLWVALTLSILGVVILLMSGG